MKAIYTKEEQFKNHIKFSKTLDMLPCLELSDFEDIIDDTDEQIKNPYSFKKGNIPWNKGIPHSKETKIKIGEIHKGNKYCVGRVCSDETRKKLSDMKKGKKRKPFTKETIEKMRLAAIKRHQAKRELF